MSNYIPNIHITRLNLTQAPDVVQAAWSWVDGLVAEGYGAKFDSQRSRFFASLIDMSMRWE